MQFAWATIHWIAGVILTLSIVYHVVHSLFFQDPWAVWIGPSDIKEAIERAKRSMSGGTTTVRHAKYPLENKLYHNVVVLAGLGVILTGIVMMFRIETWLWARDPYLFSDATWGWIYVLHGLSSISFVTLVTAHIYFAIRPEKLWLTRSMIFGWIDRRHYVEHHDPQRWVVKN